MFYTRRGGFDAAEAQAVYEDGQRKRFKCVPRVGDKVVLSENIDACVYTITEVAQRSSAVGNILYVTLMYPGLDGVMRNGGTVDAGLLLTPSAQQTERECV